MFYKEKAAVTRLFKIDRRSKTIHGLIILKWLTFSRYFEKILLR